MQVIEGEILDKIHPSTLSIIKTPKQLLSLLKEFEEKSGFKQFAYDINNKDVSLLDEYLLNKWFTHQFVLADVQTNKVYNNYHGVCRISITFELGFIEMQKTLTDLGFKD